VKHTTTGRTFELRLSPGDLGGAFEIILSYEFLGHCEVRRAESLLRFSTLAGREAPLLRRLERALPFARCASGGPAA
jgi:hypothetical protein